VYLNHYKIRRYQSAYRTGHSTETALLKVVNDIRSAADDGQCTALLALDISAAFDTVDYLILSGRVEHDFGVTGLALKWLISFLRGRSQYISVGSERSPVSKCASGVPQGSILGPLLFALYVSPVDDVVNAHHLQYHQYADDLQLYTAIKPPWSNDLSALSDCVADVTRWFLDNGLLLNPTKTEAMLFGTRQRLSQLKGTCNSVDVAGVPVNFTVAMKLLGVTLDETLSFDKHTSDVVRSCYFHLRALRRIRPLLTFDSANAIGAAIVGARLDYCNSVLYGTTVYNLNRFQRVQNSLARSVCQARWTDSASALRKTLHWLPVKERILYKTALVTFKARQMGVPPYLSDLVTYYRPTRTLRSTGTNLLNVPRRATKFGSSAFSCAAPTVWNSLSSQIRSCTSLNSFKTKLKTELFMAAYTD